MLQWNLWHKSKPVIGDIYAIRTPWRPAKWEAWYYSRNEDEEQWYAMDEDGKPTIKVEPPWLWADIGELPDLAGVQGTRK